MYHGMTVRADGAEVSDGINFIVLANRGKLEQMMDVDKLIGDHTIGCAK